MRMPVGSASSAQIGGRAMRHKMPRADSISRIVDALEFFDRGFSISPTTPAKVQM
jgi:hypothetical protein